MVGTFILGRHNDRKTKPTRVLTPLGAREQVLAGQFYRERYFGLDDQGNEVPTDKRIEGLNEYGVYVAGDIDAHATTSNVILFSHLSFLQGLYPPTNETIEVDALVDTNLARLSNGTVVLNPLGGYQYVDTSLAEEGSPEYIFIQGDDDCPVATAAGNRLDSSDWWQQKNASTLDFYRSLDLEGFPSWRRNFDNAFNVFDYMNVNQIHNESVTWNETTFQQVSLLNDQYQWARAFDEDHVVGNRSIAGQTIGGAILSGLNSTRYNTSPYIHYYTTSFDTMFQLSAVTEMYKASDNFTGMPNYGSTFVFELLRDDTGEFFVEFSAKNGSSDSVPLNPFPLFGQNETVIPWDTFYSTMVERTITTLDTWCSKCSSELEMCVPYSDLYEEAASLQSEGISLEELAESRPSLTNAQAGGIGAGVTVGVFLLIGALFVLFRKFSRNDVASIGSESSIEKASV